ncbi:MAG: hypothetical protein ACK5RP_04050, partial [Betaproteobacteria bacterium]
MQSSRGVTGQQIVVLALGADDELGQLAHRAAAGRGGADPVRDRLALGAGVDLGGGQNSILQHRVVGAVVALGAARGGAALRAA